ncbi:MAG: sugar-binding protein [Planctomycetota bacterium]|nr:sugar-binding protein [Planctomycetota bacterium]
MRQTLTSLFVLLALPIAFAEDQNTALKKTDWCKITVPKTAKVGSTINIRIKLTGPKDKLGEKGYLWLDLKDQHHKMMKWGGPKRELALGQETVYRLPVRDRVGLEYVYAYLGVVRSKDDKKSVATASTPQIPVSGASKAPEIRYNKSWLYADASNGGRQLVSGEKFDLAVDYFLDPSDHFQATTLSVWGTGPWIDTPDGKYTKKRGHIGYPGLSGRLKITKPGKGRHVFTFTVPKGLELVKENNRLLFVCRFLDSAGKSWPWHVRAHGSFIRKRGFFEIETGKPGNLFTYDEPVRIAARLKNVEGVGEKKALKWTVHDARGKKMLGGNEPFTVTRDGQEIVLNLNLQQRGVFLLQMEVPGWEKRQTTFARIPDVVAMTQGKPTRFGMTVHGTYGHLDEEIFQVARKLGLTTCRRFSNWNRMEPGPGVFKLDELDKQLAITNRLGIDMWICITKPPAWVLTRARDVGYSCFEADWDGWKNFVRTVTTRFKGKFIGWEWLNEITPGGSAPIENYFRLCRIGTETAKAIDPDLITLLAGGLFPRSYRKQALSAGIGKYIDVMPVHYQNGNGVIEARSDLDAAGLKHVAVWEDESARGNNAWGVPPLEEVQKTVQSNWVLKQWTDELAAGCERIIYFGGTPNAAGSHGYVLDDMSPRPVAATLAVFTSKLFGARPLGVFQLGDGGLFHLFARDGKPVLVASTQVSAGERVELQAGTDEILITDYQGNEQKLACKGGKAALALKPLRYFIEGADLDVLKSYVVPSINVAKVSSGTSSSVFSARQLRPRLSLIQGKQGQIGLRINNLYKRTLEGSIRIGVPDGWGRQEAVTFSLGAGDVSVLALPVSVPRTATASDYDVKLSFDFKWDKLPAVEKELVLSVLSPDMVGNLMPNGDFESPARGSAPDGFRVNNKTSMRVSSAGLGDGLGRYVVKFQNTAGKWDHTARTIPLRGGQTYLYTAWIRNQKMSAGSNMTQNLANGKQIRHYDVHVFTAGQNNDYWQLFTCRRQMAADTKTVSFAPVVKGSGWALYDNLRVTLFEGSDYVAEAFKTKTKPVIDGKLDDWNKACPIPLIGRSQLKVLDKNYTWSPENLNAIGHLMWDDANLYAAVKVKDDVHHTVGTGESANKGDCVILSIDPTNRAPGAAARSFAYYLSSASPNRGGAQHTIFRPKRFAGGKRAGHLFGDSSIYEIAITKTKGECIYEIRIPASELGLQPGFGGKLGLSLQLNDNDGKGLSAHMNWGGGLSPNWQPGNFGVVTFVD